MMLYFLRLNISVLKKWYENSTTELTVKYYGSVAGLPERREI